MFLSHLPQSRREVLIEREMGNPELALRPAKGEIALGAEYVAIKICHPLAAA